MTVLLHNATPPLVVMTAMTIVMWVAVIIYWISLWWPSRDRKHELDSETTPTTRRVRAGAKRAAEAIGVEPGPENAKTAPHVATQPDPANHGYGREVLR